MTTFSFKKDIPRFDGTNYTLCKTLMQVYLICIREEYQNITKNVYNVPQNGPTTPDEKKEAKYNIRAKEALLSALLDSEMTNVIDLETSHDNRVKFQTFHEGDSHVKVTKLQNLKGKYENLKMGEDENITSFMQKVNELVC